jgi:hypothetical protein
MYVQGYLQGSENGRVVTIDLSSTIFKGLPPGNGLILWHQVDYF